MQHIVYFLNDLGDSLVEIDGTLGALPVTGMKTHPLLKPSSISTNESS